MAAAGRGDHARAARLAAGAYAQRERFGITGPSPVLFWRRLQEWFVGGARASLAPDELARVETGATDVAFDEVVDDALRSAP